MAEQWRLIVATAGPSQASSQIPTHVMPLSKTFTKWAPFATAFFQNQTAVDGEDGQQEPVKKTDSETPMKETTSPTWYHNLLLH